MSVLHCIINFLWKEVAQNNKGIFNTGALQLCLIFYHLWNAFGKDQFILVLLPIAFTIRKKFAINVLKNFSWLCIGCFISLN